MKRSQLFFVSVAALVGTTALAFGQNRLPPVDEIVERHLQALGGREDIEAGTPGVLSRGFLPFFRLNPEWNADTDRDPAPRRADHLQALILSIQGFEPFACDTQA
jgi:hypothetical protein